MNDFGRLRRIEDSELALMLSWRNAPSVRLNMYTRHEISMDEHLAWWERLRNQSDQNYLMYEKAGKPLGIVAFNNIDLDNRHAFWAFYASPDAPRGVGSFMELLALDYAFDQLNLHKLSCEVFAFNTGVIKLHQKFGFTVEGVFRSHHLVDGAFVEVYRLGVLEDEWLQNRNPLLGKIERIKRS
ncbi:MAG: UDP-4-amino-4,6-dideoxy-N-acetyl-beta-L-altrosamine N-acetyltransferase [Halothiobacillus sp. 24-54-40]|jgi:UDP-4-amino-4,6-dideoxy-N-acetyl-beta-L-altrosamine N-acetyltransferase|nr:MAG: UDP-4-amino-4,6-dideoxy-N-acetyl-beta-L-altrosamine N-acetyltransferase [Halothiobacillus sp. 35-54-62]OYZ86851.1 MAG: UDP-4-amino-4,6-dideoxy-N-acetyl-beta-L-altrosamine N-acetyltransferase [Halothiobacillus sp. 24-54-40]OZA81024.1 MAG: UDP-4-amino-4,6-dideoxy-N-acetyl-beta-L-altrosamine N-acetyltransferase [Halothiobacillus sp. 39-53-45]HQS02503.1 UDP-4-amino-4,6-dideoxy-N-acetyl-beta-L-altrosamine N-acetyltransferase [Halothiobacillus sp.]HQS29064.1 UDP-4-amino-4,6-dideoxy-N-acetyl-b